jgi:lysophospholipase L1-like esterase
VAARVLAVVLLCFVAMGVVALHSDLTGWLLLAIWVPVVAIVALRLAPWTPARRAGDALGALGFPVLALVGVDAAWAKVVKVSLSPLVSLFFGAVIVGLAAWISLGAWWVRHPSAHRGIWAAAVTVALVLVPPPVLWLAGKIEGDERALDQPGAAVSKLDVVVLREDVGALDATRVRPDGWKVQTWVGQVRGKRIRWGPEGRPPPQTEDADRVLLLMVDGDPGRTGRFAALPETPRKKGEVRRWLRLADRAAPRSVPTFALLQSTDDERRARWTNALAPPTVDPAERRGGAVSLQEVEGSRTTTDLALRLAVRSPTSDQELALAAKHRPALFFDRDEPYPTPLNVNRLLESGKIKLCDRGQALASACSVVDEPADLHNGASHLAFDPDELAAITSDSTIYVNVTRGGNQHDNAIYLDYWWYFPNNPTGAGDGALCGAGFVIAGVTCFDHQSDWEGVTVVIDEDAPARPSAVSYAQHDGVTRYSWSMLQRLWDDGDRERFGAAVNTGQRPLVFVARGTHASYPTSCSESRCRVGRVRGVSATKPLQEQGHDGGRPWPRDEAVECPTFCVTALPTRRGGREPAQWNAFSKPWGAANCAFGFICGSDEPPPSPAFQGRYRHPWCAKRAFVFEHETFSRAPAGCPPRQPAAGQLAAGDELLALGDSFSSGEGAGSYDPDTNTDGNTCHRSPLAWPVRVAEILELNALPSLACSGAVIADVMEDGHGHEAERRRSQLGRIGGDPKLITISIGGNDTGFADVLGDCVTGDCIEKYDKPSGDVLERRAAEVGDRLPEVYRAIQRKAPGARLVVMGYPRLFPDDARALPVGNCAAADRVSANETAYLNSATRTLNAAIAAAAREAGATFVDVTDAFDGKELRCSGESYMNRLRILPRRLFKASVHPNASGHARLAEVVAARIASP